VSEADNPAEWARVMADRYCLDDVKDLAAKGEAMTVEERAEFLLIFEKLALIEAMTARSAPDPGTEPPPLRFAVHRGERGRTVRGSDPTSAVYGLCSHRPVSCPTECPSSGNALGRHESSQAIIVPGQNVRRRPESLDSRV
jgi:hypothetical protein